MSKFDANEAKLHEVTEVTGRPLRGSIPQRLSAGRQKHSQSKPRVAVNNRSVGGELGECPSNLSSAPRLPKSKTQMTSITIKKNYYAWNEESMKLDEDELCNHILEMVVSSALPPQSRFAAKPICRPRSGEQSRPKSASSGKKMKEDGSCSKPAHCCAQRQMRPEHERVSTPKKPSVIPKRVSNDTGSSKPIKPTILITAMAQKVPTKTLYTNRAALPNQDIIDKHEDLELQQSELREGYVNDLNDKDSISSRNDKLTELKVTWQKKIVEFDKIKNELKDKQKAILALYAGMGMTHKKMLALGHRTSLPPRDELQIMNVSNMTPDQLLQLCAGPEIDGPLPLTPTSIEKLYYMPSNLVSTCEHTLSKNKEIIDVLDSTLAAPEKMKTLSKKVKEYAAENEMLSCSFEKVKNDFIVEFREIVSMIRKSVNETMSLNLRNEQLICENSELNSQKDDLRKQLHEAECRRTTGVRSKIEELEKLLKEEKCKNNLLRDRLTRATCQAKISTEQISHMEAALEQSRSSCWALERTVLELQEQNQKLHKDYSLEFNKFTESIRENTAHLEEIAEAREKLQAEKEDLEKRLTELSTHYNESIKNMKKELSCKVEKIIDTEMKYDNEKEERLKLVDKVESLCAQLLESELRYKDMCRKLQEKELQLSNHAECRQELDVTKHQLAIANEEIEKYRDRFMQQCEQIKDIERNFKESAQIEETLKNDLNTREEYIVELEKKVDLLEKQRQESESKMTAYEEQLSSLKTHLSQLQEDFGEFENLTELHEMINQQRANLIEATRQNGELAEALQKKDLELEQHLETLSEQEHIIEERDDIIKILSQKEEEHTNIIKLLRTNLEMRTQAEVDYNQQLSEKNAEIESLTNNLDTRKKQICELEKIILTLENQTRKVSSQRRKAQEDIKLLEKKLVEYESVYLEKKRRNETPTENLDSIIKILEEELIGPIGPNSEHIDTHIDQKSFGDDTILRKQVHKHNFEQLNRKRDTASIEDKIQIKSVLEKCYMKGYEDFKCDIDRQRGITNIQFQNNNAPPEPKQLGDARVIQDEPSIVQGNLTRNLHYWTPAQQFRDNKKYKTFKFAAHKL